MQGIHRTVSVVFCLGLAFGNGYINPARHERLENYIENVLSDWSKFETGVQLRPKSVNESTGIANKPQVQTTSGILSGVTTDEAHQFHGVPYAKPPIGDLRFMPPEKLDLSNETGEVDVSNNTGVACPQKYEACDEGVCLTNNIEDCLVLDISVPSSLDLSDKDSPPSQSLPVLFWIYGGFFYAGSGTNQQQNGRYLSNYTNTIVVTSNYRVGPFGFLYYKDGTGDEILGNQGLKDQQLALQWVQDNIANFGGDKTKVTIFGESAGAQAVMFHLLSSTSQPLFQRAIMESNPALFSYQTPEEAAKITESLMDVIGCKNYSLECLRTAKMKDLVDAQQKVIERAVGNKDTFSSLEPYRPIIDGTEFSGQPFDLFKKGSWNSEKDVIIGTNTQELAYVIAIFQKANISNSKVVFNRANKYLYGQQVSSEVFQEYVDSSNPSNETTNYTAVLAAESTDGFFICPTRSLARFMSQTSSGGKVYLYSNAYPLSGPGCENVMVNLPGVCGYSFHGSEINFVFRTGPSFGLNFTDNDQLVSDMFSAYWGDFAYSGNPSESNNFTTWPEYQFDSSCSSCQNNETNVGINVPSSIVENQYKDDICNFWDETGLYVTWDEGSGEEMPPTTTTNMKSTTTLSASSTTSSSQMLLPEAISVLLLVGLLANCLSI